MLNNSSIKNINLIINQNPLYVLKIIKKYYLSLSWMLKIINSKQKNLSVFSIWFNKITVF